MSLTLLMISAIKWCEYINCAIEIHIWSCPVLGIERITSICNGACPKAATIYLDYYRPTLMSLGYPNKKKPLTLALFGRSLCGRDPRVRETLKPLSVS